VSPEGFEPSYFVPPRLQTNVTGTYAQQVVTRVAGYLWCLAHAWHTARICGIGASFSLCLRVAWLIDGQASRRYISSLQLSETDSTCNKGAMESLAIFVAL